MTRSSRATQTGQVLHALALLSARAWAVDDLAAALGVSRRTTQRLLAELRARGIMARSVDLTNPRRNVHAIRRAHDSA